MEKLLKVEQVAERLQISKSLIYKWVQYRYIPHIKVGSIVRFRRNNLEKWLSIKFKKGDLR